jgi:hypothetical protein
MKMAETTNLQKKERLNRTNANLGSDGKRSDDVIENQ